MRHDYTKLFMEEKKGGQELSLVVHLHQFNERIIPYSQKTLITHLPYFKNNFF